MKRATAVGCVSVKYFFIQNPCKWTYFRKSSLVEHLMQHIIQLIQIDMLVTACFSAIDVTCIYLHIWIIHRKNLHWNTTNQTIHATNKEMSLPSYYTWDLKYSIVRQWRWRVHIMYGNHTQKKTDCPGTLEYFFLRANRKIDSFHCYETND